MTDSNDRKFEATTTCCRNAETKSRWQVEQFIFIHIKKDTAMPERSSIEVVHLHALSQFTSHQQHDHNRNHNSASPFPFICKKIVARSECLILQQVQCNQIQRGSSSSLSSWSTADTSGMESGRQKRMRAGRKGRDSGAGA